MATEIVGILIICCTHYENFSGIYTWLYKIANENNITDFKSYVEGLDNELFHVSLMEYIAELNLLLKGKMCWHISDVLPIHTHKIKHKKNISSLAEEI